MKVAYAISKRQCLPLTYLVIDSSLRVGRVDQEGREYVTCGIARTKFLGHQTCLKRMIRKLPPMISHCVMERSFQPASLSNSSSSYRDPLHYNLYHIFFMLLDYLVSANQSASLYPTLITISAFTTSAANTELEAHCV